MVHCSLTMQKALLNWLPTMLLLQAVLLQTALRVRLMPSRFPWSCDHYPVL